MAYRWTRSLGGRLRLAQKYVRYLACENPDYISNLQLNKLQQVWSEAVANVPYYRNLVKMKLAPSEVKTFNDFYEGVPILTKAILQDSPELFQRNQSPNHYLMTAGSTGMPLRFGAWNSEAHIAAANMDAMRVYRGMDPRRDRIFLIWGHSHLLGSGTRGKLNNWKRKFYDLLLGYRRVDAYHIGRKSARQYMDTMMKFKPEVICGYSNAVSLFVEHNWDRIGKSRELPVKFVICTAEMMPNPEAACRVHQFFGAPLMMEYGGVDFGSVAHRWDDLPYMTNWWSYICEYLPNKVQSDSGALLVTSLYPRYVPMIRYDTGDEIKTPLMGADRQVLKFQNLEGRHHDVLSLGTDNVIHSVGLFHCIHQETSVVNIQLIINDDGFRVLLVGQPDEQAMARIRRRLADLHPQLASCSIDCVQDLQTNRAGKRRWIMDYRSK